jgi:hypothetical protein
MRRNALKFLLGASATFVAGDTFSAVKMVKEDKRLLGDWQSDKDRTIALWKYSKDISDDKRAHFESIFGKFKLNFSKTHISTVFEETKEVVRYSVIAQDSSSVVIAWHEKNDTTLQHIHFDDGGYYVISGYNIEFYKRVHV